MGGVEEGRGGRCVEGRSVSCEEIKHTNPNPQVVI